MNALEETKVKLLAVDCLKAMKQSRTFSRAGLSGSFLTSLGFLQVFLTATLTAMSSLSLRELSSLSAYS
ncbi:hypothetical protein HYU12_01895 [Candidatus Woesearchaeota archaeon]|nr:hypothetical protein [Candidatus Woesearchaeota archaeon]